MFRLFRFFGLFKLLKVIFLFLGKVIAYIQKYFKTFVLLLILLVIFYPKAENSNSRANIARLNLYGVITNSNLLLSQIDKLKKEKNIKGVLLVVNSPGGAVAPSVEIALAIKELNKIKPVVAYASGTMASGSYYSSIYSKEIIANPGALLGSIGVIFEGTDISGLLAKLGIKSQVLKRGTYKEAGTFRRAWNVQEKQELNKILDNTYKMFTEDVAKARGLNIKNAKNFANAHIFTAKGALKVGLIDKVGNMTLAKNELLRFAKIKYPKWQKESKTNTFFDKLSQKISSKVSLAFASSLTSIF